MNLEGHYRGYLPSEDSDKRCLQKLMKNRYEEIKELPMVKQFVKEKENEDLLIEAFIVGDSKSIDKLNSSFKTFYKRQKAINYAVGIIKRYSIDYDKRVKKRNNRYLLTLDKPIKNGDESSTTLFLELVQDSQQDDFSNIFKTDIFDIQNEQLRQAINKAALSPFQKKLLKLIYEDNHSQREVSKMVGQTEQNIYYWHKKTIKQLQNELAVIV